MAARRRDIFEAWARWCYSDQGARGGGRSVLARWMDGKGEIINSTAPWGVDDLIEARVDAAVCLLAMRDEIGGDVIRLEYAAGWEAIAMRKGEPTFSPAHARQSEKAQLLSIHVRTYRRRLMAVEKQVLDEIGVMYGRG